MPDATRSRPPVPADAGHGHPPAPARQVQTAEIPKSSDPLVAILNRNAFYKDGYRWLIYIAGGEAVAILLLIFLLLGIVASHEPKDRYFATTAEGRLIPMIPLNEPNIDRGKLVAWANKAATEIMTFGFHDYRQRLTEAGNKYFTQRGWNSFTTALEKSRIIEAVEGSQQVVTAAPQGAAVIVEEGVVGGVYMWVVQIPMIITYTSGNRSQANPVLLTLKIQRVPTLQNPEGIGIEQWIAGQQS
ncbi:MAG: type IVB secretion system apparatus protein IcmL/DotI [Pseudomonadota bacterium]|nr:type IVB secretion system apparatus protein IcmL/DotI [Pseudomonadota bacterium]